jgi:hypothetical protein
MNVKQKSLHLGDPGKKNEKVCKSLRRLGCRRILVAEKEKAAARLPHSKRKIAQYV